MRETFQIFLKKYFTYVFDELKNRLPDITIAGSMKKKEYEEFVSFFIEFSDLDPGKFWLGQISMNCFK